MTVSSNGTPTLTAASPSAAMSVTGTWGSGQTRTAGHLLVAAVTLYGTTTAQLGAPPAGWRLDRSITASSRCTTVYYTLIATGADAAPTVTGTTTGTAADSSLQITLYDLSDSGGATPVIAAIGALTGTSGTITPVTRQKVPGAGCLAITTGICSQGTTSASTTWTTPSGWTLGTSQLSSSQSQTATYFTTSAPTAGSTLSVVLTHSRTSTFQSAATLVAAPATSITPVAYYVSPTGNNSSAGTSTGTAWQTVAKVNGITTFNPGDSILFQGGQTFAGTTLVPPQEGTADLPVTFGSYGGGNATFTATNASAILATSTGGLAFTSLTCTGTAPSGSYNGGIQCESGDGGQHPPVTFTSCTITGFQFGATAIADTNWDGFGAVTITGCALNSNTYGGVWLAAQGGATAYCFGAISVTGNTCHGNTGQTGGVTDTSGFGIYASAVGGGVISGNTVYGNGASNPNSATGVCGIIVACSIGVTVTANLVYSQSGNASDGDGIDLDVFCLGCTVQYNLIYGCTSAGIMLFASGGAWSGNVIRFNILWGNCQGGYGAFGEISLFSTPTSTQIYNNTVVGHGGGTSAAGAFFCDNSVTGITGVTAWNNIFYSTVQQVIYTNTAFTTGQLDMQGNCYYYSGGTAHLNWAGTAYTTLAAWQTATGQEKYAGAGVGVLASPQLTAAGVGPTVTTAATITTYTSAKAGSGGPCAGTGLPLLADFGVNPGTQDFYGTTLQSPYWIGAYTITAPHSGAAGLSGSGSLTGAGVFAGAVALSGSGAITATSTHLTSHGHGTATLTGTGTLTGAGAGTFTQIAVLSGTGSLSAAWIGTLQAQPVTLSGTGSLIVSGEIRGFLASLTGQGTLSVLQATGGLVFASPGAATPQAYPGASQVAIAPPGSSNWQFLSTFGHVTALNYSFVCPGGADKMTCTVMVPATFRNQYMNPGWPVRITRGGHPVWSGRLDEPVPSAAGWTLTAVGDGNRGQDFLANYTSPWPVNQPDESINNAISRGLPWANPGVGTPSGIWFGQSVDSGAQTITALLNLVCTRGGLTWYVNSQPGGINGTDLTVFPLPTVPNRLLVCTTPVPRTLGGDINTIFIRYQATADNSSSGGTAATFATTSVQNAASVTAHGVIETFIDLSDVGVQSAGAAQAVGNNVLKIYQRASFAGPFTGRYGQLTNVGGVPLDPGTDQAGTMVRLILTDYGYGGEVTPQSPITFIVGGYTWDDFSQMFTVTPYQSVDQSLSGLLSLANTELTPITVASGP